MLFHINTKIKVAHRIVSLSLQFTILLDEALGLWIWTQA